MKVAIISDSHYVRASVEAVKAHITDVDMVLHCGDGAPDIEKIVEGTKVDYFAVRGNCDFAIEYPTERIIDVCGKKIFMCHGHMYGVKSGYNNIFYKGKEVGADVVLFGHSHNSTVIKEQGIILMNPGSISSPALGKPCSIGILEIEEGREVIGYIKEI